MAALAMPDVPVDPLIDRVPPPRATTFVQILQATRSCNVGAVIRNYSPEPGYALNWWCEYGSWQGQYFPVRGYSVSIRLVGGKVQLRNFASGRYGPIPRVSN
jgi:hypothetical protein